MARSIKKTIAKKLDLFNIILMAQYREEIKDLNDLKKLAKALAARLKPPQFVLLEGPVGAGKTRLVQYMAREYGCLEGEVRSPSFSLINVYQNTNQEAFFHVDLYRLNKPEDLENTGIWDLFRSPALVFIEWPEMIKDQLPLFWNRLEIEINFAEDLKSRALKWREKSPVKP